MSSLRSLALAASLLPFCAIGAEFPEPFNTEKIVGAPMPADEAAAQVQAPPGFRVTAFAAEPDVRQPIAMTTDARGRLWVAENYTYAERGTDYDMRLRDRILIFEDTDNDGRHDKRTVFWDGAQRLTSIEVGLGGVWALCLPELLFIADENGDDVPDAAPVAVLDGFDYKKGRHTMANGLKWGPDGWLYGRQGILTHSPVGRPGAPDAERVTINVGVWRYQPVRRVFESVAVGTTNPWGMDWDAHGEGFFINTVIGHLWHIIPGAHYRRMSGADLDPRIYDILEQHADHVHWATGEVWTDVRKGVTDATLAAGGGHAHTGLLIYQGGQWPDEWQGKLLTVNFHGRRFNVERLERRGTGYVGRREPEAFLFADPWFRGIDLIAAPDGGVFVSDWSDAGECHDHDGVHRQSGRIFKISYGEPKPLPYRNLASLGGVELAQLQLSPNDWLARMSRRVLAQSSPELQLAARPELERIVASEANVVHRLRALWALHGMGKSDPAQLSALLGDKDEHLRAWSIRLLGEIGSIDLPAFTKVAAQDESGLVRLALASLLQKLPPPERLPLAAALLARSEDAADHNQPLMLWVGILPLAELHPDAFVKLIADARIPVVQRYGARRLAEDIDTQPAPLAALIAAIAARGAPESRAALLDGLADGFAGRRQAPKPATWDAALAALASASAQDRVRDLSALFGDGLALDSIRAAALAERNGVPQRLAALRTLVESRAPGLRETCEQLLAVPGLVTAAAAGLAQFDDPALAARILAAYPTLDGADRNPILATLISRPAWTPQVLDAIAAGRVERERLTAPLIRQIRGYQDAALTARLERVLGRSAPASPNIARWKERLTPAALAQADRASGRAVFQTACAACHKLNGEGGPIGPDLTGAARDNLDYLLENIVTPSATVADDFRLVTLTLKDGRVLAGTVKARTPRTLQLQTPAELLTFETGDIAAEAASPLSLMPEGLLEVLPPDKARDLIAYLMAK